MFYQATRVFTVLMRFIFLSLAVVLFGLNSTKAEPVVQSDTENPKETRDASSGIVGKRSPSVEAESAPNQEWLLSRYNDKRILLCRGVKDHGSVECEISKKIKVKTDIYYLASSGWALKQVVPDEKSGVWYFFFQQM